MENVVLTIHLILALLLIGVVLLQRSEGGGLLSGGGAMSGRQAANALTKLTWIFAGCFIATSIALTVIASQKAKGTSVIDQATNSAPAPEAAKTPALPAPEGDLLPPAPAGSAATTAPAAPAPAAPATTAPATTTAPASN